jgi:histone deacetylase complex subunit SAP18
VSTGRHNALSDYNNGSTPTNELQIYTWLDCTLRELSSLIKDVNVESRKRGVEFRFSVGMFFRLVWLFNFPVSVTPHPRSSRFILNDVGVVTNGERGNDDSKTLSSCNFAIGDYIDVSFQ